MRKRYEPNEIIVKDNFAEIILYFDHFFGVYVLTS